MSTVTQRKRQELGNLRRIVDEQDARQPSLTFCWRRRQADAPSYLRRAQGP
jgi:hypothetical protein